MPDALADRIEETLRPIVGTVLAAVSVDVEARRIGKTAETITPTDLEDIAVNLTNRLKMFVGSDLALAAGQRVRELAYR